MKNIKIEEESEAQTGRWNRIEHQSFIEAIKIYGKNWKLVANYIGTRNSTQVRSHAQKYFLRETTKQVIRQQAQEYFAKSPKVEIKSEKIDAYTQYGEGITFIKIGEY
jgi:SHAQKYF class myb-like DNA-binding protein